MQGYSHLWGGDITYGGRSIQEYSRTDLARTIGYISTEIVKVSNMRVYDLVALGRFPYTNWFGKIDKYNHDIITDAIEKTGMASLSWRFISELSDGERQKAMIARILAQDTGILVMDEPTAFLDIGSKFEILHLMHLLSQNSGKTIIFSTHDLNVAMSQADKIWLIIDDHLLEGAPEDLMLQGAFDHLFDSSAFQYNSEDGTYSFITENRGEINVSGEGIMLHYTKKAINRAGFSVTEGEVLPYLKLPSGSCRCWQLIESNSVTEFGSLYEFVNRIIDYPPSTT
ncbi:MAG: ABC transporter ATP-binding protein [Bacteroidales bacterium]|nr:ABC transporter ATP-binding protein [Bacteroidales bacterium]